MQEARGRGKIGLCAFCREPNSRSDKEETKRIKKCIDADNAHAFNVLASDYVHLHGNTGVQKDLAKANELYLRGGELGCAEAYCNLGFSYDTGRAVEVDMQKAKHFYELAAMSGDVVARHNLGIIEGNDGNHNRAKKHFILSARAGHKDRRALNQVKNGFMRGVIKKDE